MQELAKLIYVLDSISDKSNIKFKSNKHQSLESEFIKGIISKKFLNDKDAAFNLYGTDQSDVRYKMLKHRLKKKLFQQLLVADIIEGEGALQKEQECLKLINLAKLLVKKLQYDIVLGICSKIKSIATAYEFNEFILIAYELESNCYMNTGSFKQFELSKSLEDKYHTILSLEREATSLYQKTKVYLRSTVKNRKLFLQELPLILERLKEIWITTKSIISYNAFLKTSILSYELEGEFNEIIKITEETDKLLNSNEINRLRFDTRYNAYILVYAHLRNKSFDDGLKCAEKYLSYFDQSTPNWFSYMENYLLLSLHAKHYDLAAIVIDQVQHNNSFKGISIDSKERWHLYYAYLHFFKPDLAQLEGFNYLKFMSSLAGYSKDKQGFNVAILILQFIHFLKKNDSEALLYRIESLKKYSSTHLKDPSSLRSRLFLKLLMLIVTEDFDADLSRIKGSKIYLKLSETPTPGDAYAEIEIIPYEHLWEMVLEILENRN
jgi:hypothetical protein